MRTIFEEKALPSSLFLYQLDSFRTFLCGSLSGHFWRRRGFQVLENCHLNNPRDFSVTGWVILWSFKLHSGRKAHGWFWGPGSYSVDRLGRILVLHYMGCGIANPLVYPMLESWHLRGTCSWRYSTCVQRFLCQPSPSSAKLFPRTINTYNQY